MTTFLQYSEFCEQLFLSVSCDLLGRVLIALMLASCLVLVMTWKTENAENLIFTGVLLELSRHLSWCLPFMSSLSSALCYYVSTSPWIVAWATVPKRTNQSSLGNNDREKEASNRNPNQIEGFVDFME